MTQAKIIAEKATAILFLNQQWLAHLSEVLDRNGLLDETLDGLINHAKTENRQAFNEINKLGKDAEDTISRRTVGEALTRLRLTHPEHDTLTAQQKARICEALARAQGWKLVNDGYWQCWHSPSGEEKFIRPSYNEVLSDPFADDAACRALVEWVAAKSDIADKFNWRLRELVGRYGFDLTPLEALTAPRRVIVQAACAALGIPWEAQPPPAPAPAHP